MDTTHLILFAVAIVVLVGFVSAIAAFFRGGRAQTYPFVRIDSLFSPAERSFFGVLSQVIGDRYVIFGKIRLADVIRPQPGVCLPREQLVTDRLGFELEYERGEVT